MAGWCRGVTSFVLAGLELRFFSHDHMPPHFHAEKPGEWEVRVFFLRNRSAMLEVKYSFRTNRPSKTDVKQLTALAEAHRVALLAEWEKKVSVKGRGTGEL